MIAPCPHCEMKDDVYRNVRMFGWAQEYFRREDGGFESLDLDKSRVGDSKTFRCCSCLKVRRDIILVGYVLRMEHSQ